MSIYTKTGDKGETSIYKKKAGKNIRLSKSDPLIEAIGSVDEANSYIGIVKSKIKYQKSKLKVKNQNLEKKLQEIQRDLFAIGAGLAGVELKIQESRIKNLESSIDNMERVLPKLTGFILPGGSEVSAHIMYARALVRRVERKVVGLPKKLKINHQSLIIKYLNRLSDYLFVLARWVNYQNKVKEVGWKE